MRAQPLIVSHAVHANVDAVPVGDDRAERCRERLAERDSDGLEVLAENGAPKRERGWKEHQAEAAPLGDVAAYHLTQSSGLMALARARSPKPITRFEP